VPADWFVSMGSMGAATVATPDVNELVEQTLRANKKAIEQADEAAAKLKEAVDESDERVEPAVKRLRRIGLLKDE
jgi:hypothetical protein